MSTYPDVTPEADSPAHGAQPSTIAMLLLFGSITFATVGLTAKTWLMGDYRALYAALSSHTQALQWKFISAFTLLYQFSLLGLVLFLSYVLEHHPLFPHSPLSQFDADEMMFFTLLVFLAAAYTTRRNDGKILPPLHRKEFKEEKPPSPPTPKEPKTLDDLLLEDDSALLPPTIPTRTFARKEPLPVSPSSDILNKSQTQEWKGWMIVVLLAFRYTTPPQFSFSMNSDDFKSDVPSLYNNISQNHHSMFLFLTGYHHFSYFYTQKDYSLARVLRVLFRINFTAFFLCLMHNNPYIFYYVCPLHSYFFLLTYFTMKIYQQLNYHKLQFRMKLLGLACFIFFLWDVNSPLFQVAHLPFFTTTPPVPGAPRGPMWEWYFRTVMHHWATFFGIVFAANQPIASLIVRKLEVESWKVHVFSKGVMGLGLLSAVGMWWSGPLRGNVRRYGAVHAYFGIVPILAYVYFRNSVREWREYTLELFYRMGEFALEAYLFHHHLLFSSNGNTILTILPGWPKINLGLVLLLYMYLSRHVFFITSRLRSVLLPATDERLCGRSMGVLALFVSSFYAVAVSLVNMGLCSLGTLAVITIICGVLIYQTVLDMTWGAYVEAGRRWRKRLREEKEKEKEERKKEEGKEGGKEGEESDDEEEEEDGPVAKISPPIIATILIFLLGLGWHTLALVGAGKIQPSPSNCAIYANNGQWKPLPLCSSFHRGTSYRLHSISGGFGQTCSSSYNPHLVWGWFDTPSSSLCRFSTRTNENTLPTLHDRTIVFIGDGMMKSLFHSFCRTLLNDFSAGAYDATVPKHSDITKYFESTKLEYKWAPLAVDQLETLKEYRSSQTKPDLIVMGGGVWDRLHVWATDEDQGSLKETVLKLTSEMKSLKKSIPIVWMIPTVINTKALNQEEKRSQMGEEAVTEMREFYGTLGVLKASTFVLDGRSFTHERVEESFDGIHYPPTVYDAGVQILANAMDWILPPSSEMIFDSSPPEPGILSNTSLGLMMLCFALIGLFFYDGYLGFSYLGSLASGKIMPNDLYEEAFAPLHARWKLPMEGLGMEREREREVGNTQEKEMLIPSEDLELSEDLHSR